MGKILLHIFTGTGEERTSVAPGNVLRTPVTNLKAATTISPEVEAGNVLFSRQVICDDEDKRVAPVAVNISTARKLVGLDEVARL